MNRWIVVTQFLVFLASFLVGKSYAAEDDLYNFLWLDPDKKVYVLQNKVYEKKNTWYGDIGYIKGLSSDFQDTYGVQFNGGYYFHEEYAFEINYNQYTNNGNSTLENLERINGVSPFLRRVRKSYGGSFVWSPFYGKINTFNRIYYFDWSFSVGLLRIEADSNRFSAIDPTSNTFVNETFTGGLLKTGFKFHLNQNIHLNINLQNTYFKAYGPVPGKPKKMYTNTDVIIGIGFSF